MLMFLLGMYTAGFIYYFRSYLDLIFSGEMQGYIVGLFVVIFWPIIWAFEWTITE